jgi:hypothetical protein
MNAPTADPLEKILSGIRKEAVTLTSNKEHLAAVDRLLQDCRDIRSTGRTESALALAQHLAVSIPSYFRG